MTTDRTEIARTQSILIEASALDAPRGWAMSRMAAPMAPTRSCPPAAGFGRYADWYALPLPRYRHGLRARLTAIADEGGPYRNGRRG